MGDIGVGADGVDQDGLDDVFAGVTVDVEGEFVIGAAPLAQIDGMAGGDVEDVEIVGGGIAVGAGRRGPFRRGRFGFGSGNIDGGEATSAELRSDWTRESLAPWDFRVDSCAGVRALASLRWLTSVRMDLSVSLARTQRETSLKFTGAAVRPMAPAKTVIAVMSIIFVECMPQV